MECINLISLQALYTNRIFLFTLFRYLVYVLLFARGILLANFLGPYLFGTFGFFNMFIQYLVICSLGLQYAITVQISTGSNLTSEGRQQYISSALFMTFSISLLLSMVGFAIYLFDVPLFDKYNFNRYSIIIGLNGGLSLIMQVLINTHRAYGSLAKIVAAELSTSIIMLIVIFAFKGDSLLPAALTGITVCGIISIAILLLHAPFNMTLLIDLHSAKRLLQIGIPLLIFNVSFILMALSAQSVVSYYYPCLLYTSPSPRD